MSVADLFGVMLYFLIICGILFIVLGFVLIVLRNVIFWIVTVGGIIFSIILSFYVYQKFNNILCPSGFFIGLLIYIIVIASVIKKVILAYVFECFAIGTFCILTPLLVYTGNFYIFVILWFILTFILFYIFCHLSKLIKKSLFKFTSWGR